MERAVGMTIVPLTLAQANELVAALHRHHKPVLSHRFSIGVEHEAKLVGAAIVGRPVCRNVEQYRVAEVTRLVTDGTKNACSILYAAAARIAREMGFNKIQTYILIDEPGTSLKAAAWEFEVETPGGQWTTRAVDKVLRGAGPRRTDQPTVPKQRWAKVLKEAA